MNKKKGLVVLMLAGLWLVQGPGWPGSQARAQSGSSMTEQQRRELEKKYQEQWDYLERLDKQQEDTGARLDKAVKRRQDAEKRQREAEQRLREQEQEEPNDKTD